MTGSDEALQAYAEALQRDYVDFRITHSFEPPRLNRLGADLEALLPKCTLQEDVITSLLTFEVKTTGNTKLAGKTGILNSTVVKLDFQEDWHGLPATIAVKMLPDGTPRPAWFHRKVYHLPDGDCAQRPANVPRVYDRISPNLRYFVVLSNGEDTGEQAWEITLE